MRLSHINILMPKGAEDAARAFYVDLLGLREIPKPLPLRKRGGIWLDAGGIDIHISIESGRGTDDIQSHFGLECLDVNSLRARLLGLGFQVDEGRPAPWKRFFIHDPFGNRIEVHEAGALRS